MVLVFLQVGGATLYGAVSGRFNGNWNNSATNSNWNIGALHFFRWSLSIGHSIALALAKN